MKLKFYASILAILLLVLTLSVVRKAYVRHDLPERSASRKLSKSDLDFLGNSDTQLSDVRIEKIQPLLGGKPQEERLRWERDPFWPLAKSGSGLPVYLKKVEKKKKPAFRLEGIISRGRVRKAIINGHVVRVGNRVGGSFRVKLITNNMVVLIGPTREVYLHF